MLNTNFIHFVYVQSDPLGLNAAPAESGESNLGNGQRKRRSSGEQGAGPNTLKRAKVKKQNKKNNSLWWSQENNLHIDLCVTLLGGAHHTYLSQHPWRKTLEFCPWRQTGTDKYPFDSCYSSCYSSSYSYSSCYSSCYSYSYSSNSSPIQTLCVSPETIPPPSSRLTSRLVMSFCFRIYWDLDVQTNAVIRERPSAMDLPPHPEIELQRAQLVTKLRQHYHELCHQREGNSLVPLRNAMFRTDRAH